MSKPFTDWTVLPHGKLAQIDDGILTASGDLPMPIGDFPRRMTIVRLTDRRLVIFSAIALDDDEMAAIEAFGTPSFLVVPNDIHRMDARIWKDRYPSLSVLAPAAAREKVEEIVPVDATSFDFGDPRVSFVTVPGTGDREAALVVRTGAGTTLVVNDLIWNVDELPGFGGFMMGAIGMTGDRPRIPGLVAMLTVKNKSELAAQLERWASIRDLRRIIVSHGRIVAKEPAATLHRLAADLEHRTA